MYGISWSFLYGREVRSVECIRSRRRTCTGHHGSPERIVFHTVSGVLPYEPRGPSLRLTLFYARRVTCPRSVSYELNASRNDFTIQFLFPEERNPVYFTLCNQLLPLDFAPTNISLLYIMKLIFYSNFSFHLSWAMEIFQFYKRLVRSFDWTLTFTLRRNGRNEPEKVYRDKLLFLGNFCFGKRSRRNQKDRR